MKTASPYLLPGADPDALIREARRRQRRRYLTAGLVIVLVLAAATGLSVGLRGHTGRVSHSPQRPRRAPASGHLTTAVALSGQPRFFADVIETDEGNGTLEIRASATGKLVADDGQAFSHNVNGLTATGPGNFLLAQQVGDQCASQLYQVRLNGQGDPGAPTPVGPELHGEVASLAASGGLIGYAVTGCSKGEPGYIGVMDTRTGFSRRWSDVDVLGISPGNVAVTGSLSMSANGRWLAFAGWDTTASGHVTRQVVRVLPVTAAAGTVAGRSRVVLSRPVTAPALDAVSLSPDGTSVYTCNTAGSEISVARYQTATGALLANLARLGGAVKFPPAGCQMTLDTTGQYLLLAYLLNPARGSAWTAVRVASISVATGRTTPLTINLGQSGMDPVSGMNLAW